jgi:CRISPR-associated endonuclease/helicase Cas3
MKIIENRSTFWGKSIRDPATGLPSRILPLAAHCLDVAHVFRRLAELPLIRRRLEAAAGCSLDAVRLDRLAVVAVLHDLGKANLGFQDKIFDPRAPRAGHIRELAPLFAETDLNDRLAEALGIDELLAWFEPSETLEAFLIAAWSHHGSPVLFDDSIRTGHYHPAKTHWWRPDGKGRDPFAAVAEMVASARHHFPFAFEPGGTPIPDSPKLQHRFAGLVMLADWLGSHTAFFPIDRPAGFDYRDAADRAVRSVGLDPGAWQEDLAARPADFAGRFGFAPHPLQAAVADLAADAPGSHLLIAEAETGSGKTEAALARFFALFAAGAVDSLYFALPTRVAARELYGRVCDYVRRNFPDPDLCPPVLLAVPGYVQVDGVAAERALPEDKGDGWLRWHDEPADLARERLWAAEHPKRFLAAPVAVGTVDQALLSVLQTHHAHLRSACLDRALLVVDEVHASDAYLRRLLKDLLEHHLSLGGHALLLSATLGAQARVEFTAVAGGGEDLPSFEDASATPYPALTDAAGTLRPVAPTESAEAGKTVRVELIPAMAEPVALLPRLAKALADGARVLAVMNTVDRAVALLRAAEAHSDIPETALFRYGAAVCPHHGRFAPEDRAVLDLAVTRRLGRDSPPGPLLLIGTQTLEQSLDIDADFLVTDLCPMDVLLQRIGRLARHRRDRPAGYGSPHRCLVLAPPAETLEEWLNDKGEADGTGKRCGLGSVYEDLRVLELTRRRLAEAPEFAIPRDNRRLVEGATHPERLACLEGNRWSRHGQNVEGIRLGKAIAADLASLKNLYAHRFGDRLCAFHELNDKARTRLGLNTLSLPLDRAVASPFGQTLQAITLPGRFAPEKLPDDPVLRVVSETDGLIELTLGEHGYRYSRYGLEKLP